MQSKELVNILFSYINNGDLYHHLISSLHCKDIFFLAFTTIILAIKTI